jgi:alpha-tubulin suppressor-like RCC1 family protein
MFLGCTPDAGLATGDERGGCYPNGTCNRGLSCFSNLCVRYDGVDAQTDEGATGGEAAAGSDVVSPVCGNGIVEGAEICDDGAPSPTCGTNCQIRPRVVTGVGHSCALGPTGTVKCWGNNSLGQLVVPLLRFKQVSAGDWHTCGVTLAGGLACWGSRGTAKVASPVGLFRQVSAGTYHTCGIRASGTISCWGLGVTASACDPNGFTYECGQAAPPSGQFAAVEAGAFHNCALDDAGRATCWGNPEFGQSTPPMGTFAALSAGTLYTCGLDAKGVMTCWGEPASLGTLPGAATGPFAAVSVGVLHACALNSTGTIVCWGDNTFGQTAPPLLGPNERGISISAARAHSCAVLDDGNSYRVACWGAGVTSGTCDLTMAQYQCGQSQVPVGAL